MKTFDTADAREAAGDLMRSIGGDGAADSFAVTGETIWSISTPADVARLARTVEATRVAMGHALNARYDCLAALRGDQY